MTPFRLLQYAIRPALAELAAYGIPPSFEAERLLLAIALQESRADHRRQVTAGGEEAGPARSFWQGEITGGMCLTLKHRRVAPAMRKICEDFNVEPTARGLWDAIQYQDIVAAAAARLLLYTLPSKLADTAAEGWAQYIDAWRPGKPHLATWGINWNLATRVVEAGREA